MEVVTTRLFSNCILMMMVRIGFVRRIIERKRSHIFAPIQTVTTPTWIVVHVLKLFLG